MAIPSAPELVPAWVEGWTVARRTPAATATPWGLHVRVGAPGHEARHVLPETDEALLRALSAAETAPEVWIKALLQDRLPAQTYGRQLLRPGAAPPGGVPGRGKVTCSCFGVTQTAIGEHLASSMGSEVERLAGLQSALQCGTKCGSCTPELKRMVRAAAGPVLAEAQ